MLGRLPNERLRPVRPAVDRRKLGHGMPWPETPQFTSLNLFESMPVLDWSRERSGEGRRLTKDQHMYYAEYYARVNTRKEEPWESQSPGALLLWIINTQMLVRTMPCASTSNALKIGIITTTSYYINQTDLPRSLMPRLISHGKHLDIPQPAESNKSKKKTKREIDGIQKILPLCHRHQFPHGGRGTLRSTEVHSLHQNWSPPSSTTLPSVSAAGDIHTIHCSANSKVYWYCSTCRHPWACSTTLAFQACPRPPRYLAPALQSCTLYLRARVAYLALPGLSRVPIVFFFFSLPRIRARLLSNISCFPSPSGITRPQSRHLFCFLIRLLLYWFSLQHTRKRRISNYTRCFRFPNLVYTLHTRCFPYFSPKVYL